MAQETVEAMLRVLNEAFSRGDVEAVLGFTADDVEVRPPTYRLEGIAFHGHVGVRALMERIAETWQAVDFSPRGFTALGDHYVMALDVRLTGHGSGAPVDQRSWTVYTLRDGKVATSFSYPSEREAQEAAGLRE
jgi:ketosteroid isomerase-like protein